jgi:hypothetical protein
MWSSCPAKAQEQAFLERFQGVCRGALGRKNAAPLCIESNADMRGVEPREIPPAGFDKKMYLKYIF